MKTLITILCVVFTTSTFAKNNYFAHPNESSGQLILIPNKITSSLFPVTLLSINGNEVAHRSNSVWIKPGDYTLSFSAEINHKYAGGNGINIRRATRRGDKLTNSLDITIEDNKVYYIAFDAHDDKQENWRPIIWKVKE